MTERKARVLIVENDETYRNQYLEMVEELGFKAVIAEGIGDDLFANAISKCREFGCHAAIVDMRLRDNSGDEDFSGINEVAVSLSPASVIVVSGTLEVDVAIKKIKEVKSKHRMTLEFVSKERVYKVLHEMIRDLVITKSSAARGITLNISPKHFEVQVDSFLSRMGYGDDIDSGKEVLGDLLIRLYNGPTGFTLSPIDPIPGTSSSTLTRNSLVCRVEFQGPNRMDQVVKFARPYAIEAEYQNYKNHVYRHVPWQSYAGLSDDFEAFYQIGAIGLDTVSTKPFSTRYRLANDQAEINSIKDSIHYFAENWTHYKSYRATEEFRDGKDFLDVYTNVWDQNKVNDPNADTFRKRLDEAITKERWEHQLPGGLVPDPTLPNPIYWLKDRVAKESSFCSEKIRLRVTHGDAWGENLFVTSQGTTIWIDFERTGLGYNLQDFVRLEFDVLTRLIQQNDDESGWRNLFHLYVASIKNNELNMPTDFLSWEQDFQKGVDVVFKIRQEAMLHAHGNLDTHQYLTAMLFDAVFRATLRSPQISGDMDDETKRRHEEDLDAWEVEKRRALLLGAIIVDKFKAHNRSWPPLRWGQSLSKDILRKAFTDYPFSRETIAVLMLEVMGKGYDEFGGDALQTKKISFYKSCEEHQKLDNLLKAIQKKFPDFARSFGNI